jgi:acyl carrier protein
MIFEEILKRELGDGISIESKIDDSAIESLEYLAFIKALEDEYRLTLDEVTIQRCETFRDLYDLIRLTPSC